jgi:ferritin-like metal-binding protein YciE
MDTLKDKLIGYIQDAYAMENEIAQVLQRQIDVSGKHPEIQAKLTQHLAETELQRKRMEQRLAAYDTTPSMVKGAASAIMGNVVGLTGALRGDMLTRNMRDDYVTEHLEIAAYTLLITTARACGDEETARQAELSLREEVAMADWIFQHLPITLVADLQDQGVEIPRSAIDDARGPSMRVTFEPLKDVQAMRHAARDKE